MLAREGEKDKEKDEDIEKGKKKNIYIYCRYIKYLSRYRIIKKML